MALTEPQLIVGGQAILRNFRSFKIRHIWLRCSWPPHYGALARNMVLTGGEFQMSGSIATTCVFLELDGF